MDYQEVKDLHALREYNQNLLNLMKQKQVLTRGAVNGSLPLNGRDLADSQDRFRTSKLLKDTLTGLDRNTEILGVSKPIRSESARRKLSSLTHGKQKYNVKVPEPELDKYSKYRETDASTLAGKGMSRKTISQGIETDYCDTHPKEKRSKSRFEGHLNNKDVLVEREDSFSKRDWQKENLRMNLDTEDLLSESFDRDLEKELQEAKEILDEVRLSTESERTRTSTPMGTPQKSLTPQNTPRSILKRRQIIDDNVKVDSKYPHTPVNKLTPKHKGLNYSYSDVDDLRIAEGNLRSSEDFRPRYSSATDGSFIEEMELTPRHVYNETAEKSQKKKASKVDTTMSDEVEKLVQKSRLLDAGNDRQNASVVRELSTRPKAVVFDLEAPEPPDTTSHSVTMQSQSQSTKSSLPDSTQNASRSFTRDVARQPLLGYDWIAGVLDNAGNSIDQPDDYFKELNDFRRVNKSDCQSNELHFSRSLARPVSPEIQDPKHTCIHGYTLNGRLFTEPMNVDEKGTSVCPICLIGRKPPTQLSPGFVRVSVPRSTIASPYQIIPHRRRSFDPSDTYALGNHCLAGWQNAQPSAIPTASTVDLKQGVKEKEILSYNDVQKMAESISKMGRLLDSSKLSSAADMNATRNLSSADTQKATKDLLNSTHSLRAELQTLEKIRGLDWSAGPNSTNYPML